MSEIITNISTELGYWLSTPAVLILLVIIAIALMMTSIPMTASAPPSSTPAPNYYEVPSAGNTPFYFPGAAAPSPPSPPFAPSAPSRSKSTVAGIEAAALASPVAAMTNGNGWLCKLILFCFFLWLLYKVLVFIYGKRAVDSKIHFLPSRTPLPLGPTKPQVFNTPENDLVYADAKALCSAYGARLATYKEIEDAYNAGGEWCNYGWSDGQMALFPTQQTTFDTLQTIPGHENDCGRPGINGGFMPNPMMRFGANCYGYKPDMSPEEEWLMANDPIFPTTAKDIAMAERIKYWKDKLESVIVSPFNPTTWSKV